MSEMLWVLAALSIALGIAGSVLPIIPGAFLIFVGALLAGFADGFKIISQLSVGILAGLAILAWITDYIAGLLGAQKAGASWLAIIGATIGTILGIFSGFIGLFFFPFIGAVVGEYIARQNEQQAIKVGFATWLGMLIGLCARLIISFIMVAIIIFDFIY